MTAQTTRPKPVALCILDGWGDRTEREANAVALADTPNFDAYADSGAFDPDTRKLKILRTTTDDGELVLAKVDAEIVGQLRYTYAVNLAQELGRWISRIGLDFLATN